MKSWNFICEENLGKISESIISLKIWKKKPKQWNINHFNILQALVGEKLKYESNLELIVLILFICHILTWFSWLWFYNTTIKLQGTEMNHRVVKLIIFNKNATQTLPKKPSFSCPPRFSGLLWMTVRKLFINHRNLFFINMSNKSDIMCWRPEISSPETPLS